MVERGFVKRSFSKTRKYLIYMCEKRDYGQQFERRWLNFCDGSIFRCRIYKIVKWENRMAKVFKKVLIQSHNYIWKYKNYHKSRPNDLFNCNEKLKWGSRWIISRSLDSWLNRIWDIIYFLRNIRTIWRRIKLFFFFFFRLCYDN